jgi:hypothetical protein
MAKAAKRAAVQDGYSSAAQTGSLNWYGNDASCNYQRLRIPSRRISVEGFSASRATRTLSRNASRWPSGPTVSSPQSLAAYPSCGQNRCSTSPHPRKLCPGSGKPDEVLLEVASSLLARSSPQGSVVNTLSHALTHCLHFPDCLTATIRVSWSGRVDQNRGCQ